MPSSNMLHLRFVNRFFTFNFSTISFSNLHPFGEFSPPKN